MKSLTVIAAAFLGCALMSLAQENSSTNAPVVGASKVLEARFSPDGQQVVTTSANTNVRVWDVRTGKPLADKPAHIGTWQLVSYKYGGGTTWSDAPQGQRRLKFITPTHFIWTAYDVATGKVETTAGGTYTLDGTAYTEFIQFAGEGMTDYLNKKQTFTLRIEEDKWNQSGQLSDGTKIEEVWQRVK